MERVGNPFIVRTGRSCKRSEWSGIEDASGWKRSVKQKPEQGVKRATAAIVSLVRFDSNRLVYLWSVARETREVRVSPWRRRRWKVVPRNRTLKPRHIDPRVAPRRLSPDCRSLLLRVYPSSTRNRLWKYTEEFYGEKGWRVVGPRRAAPEATFSYDIFLRRFHGRAAAFFELGCSSAG